MMTNDALYKNINLDMLLSADIDECSIDFVNTCDENALCYNVIGSFQCQCNHGYRGDGRTCTRKLYRSG